MKHSFTLFLLVAIPLILGETIYTIDLRTPPHSVGRTWIRNYFPDALWAFAFTAALIFTGITHGKKLLTLILVLSIAFILELLQQDGIGTYDPLDFIAYAIGATCVCLISIPEKLNPIDYLK